MFGKIIAFIAVLAAVAIAEPCGITDGYLSNGLTGYGLGGCGSRVLNAGYSVPVVSAAPSCAPIATPSLVVDPIPTTAASGVAGTGVYGSGVYGGYGYGSVMGGCGAGILPTVC